MKKFLLLICVLFPCALFAQNIMEIKNDTLHSATYGCMRHFRVAMPTGMPSDTKYNLLFVLDADYAFDVVAAAAIYLQTFDCIPPTAVIAVDYTKPGRRSDVGFSTEQMSLNASGAKFYNYLNDELLPAVCRKIPASGFNTLVGHSYTATYLLHHIARGNTAFSSYLLFTPEQTDCDISSVIPDRTERYNPVVRIITADKDIKERRRFGEKICKILRERNYDASLKTVAADHMTSVPVGSPVALGALYDRYRNVDWLWEQKLGKDRSLWDLFTEVERWNESRYCQPPRVTGGHVSFFLGSAIRTKDIESARRFIDYYAEALNVEEPEANALGCFGDLLRRAGRVEQAEQYFRRGIEAYGRLGRAHETWYWRQTYALYVLPALERFDEAWTVLEESKGIFADDSAAFDYYQGVLSVRHDYRLADGIAHLQRALEHPTVLSDNFISVEDAEATLQKAVEKSDSLQ